MKFKFILGWICLLCTCALSAGQELRMSISQALQMADSSSVSIQAARSAAQAAQAELAAADKSSLPDISIALSASYLGDGFVSERDFSDLMKVHIPSFGNSLSLEASQLIYGGGVIKAGKETASNAAEVSRAELDATRQDVFFTLCAAMLDIYRTDNAIEIFDHNIALAEKELSSLEARCETGAALSNDITRYRLHIDNLSLQREKLQNARQIVNNQITTTLQIDKNIRIVPKVEKESENSTSISSSPAMRKLNSAVSIADSKVKIERSSMLPKVALYAGAMMDGPIVVEIPPLNNNLFYWSVGVSLKYDLSLSYKSRDKVKASTLNAQSMRQTQTHVAEELTDAMKAAQISLTEADREMEVARKSMALAEENYRIVSERYGEGLALMTDMLDASDIVLKAELDLRNAEARRILCTYKIKHIAGTLNK